MSHDAWMAQAESDLAAARVLNAARFHSQAVWFAAQSVEKAHKAVLVALGLRYEERHFKHLGHTTSEIAKLLPQALHEPDDPEIGELVTKLQARGASSRYPSPPPGTAGAPLLAPATSYKNSARDVADAERLVEWCRQRVERAAQAVLAMAP